MLSLLRRKIVRLPSLVLAIVTAVLGFLIWETTIAAIPASLSQQLAFLQALPKGWQPIVTLFVLSFALFLVALGPDRVEPWARRLSGQHYPQLTGEDQSVLDALERYLDRMQQLILDEEYPLAELPYDHPRRTMAATRTREILRRLGPKQKRDTMWFLYEHGLIMRDGVSIVRLAGADFSGADLARLELWQTNLDGVDLSGADLSGAMLCGFHEHDASWQKAIEKGGRWEDSLIPDRLSSLSGVKLSGAVLRRAKLATCDVVGANFYQADLEDADLRGANLQLAQNLTQEQIESAFGSSGGLEYMPDTLLPDHLTAPEAWKKLLSQQVEVRGRPSQILNEFRVRRPDFDPQVVNAP